jgi:hypothetical protein
MAFRKLRTRIRRALDRNRPAILVASMGRSGSTVTYLALIKAAQNRGQADARTLAWTLADDPLPPAKIIKTHDFPEGLRTRPEKTRTIFNIVHAWTRRCRFTPATSRTAPTGRPCISNT